MNCKHILTNLIQRCVNQYHKYVENWKMLPSTASTYNYVRAPSTLALALFDSFGVTVCEH